MATTLLYTIITLSLIGAVSALALFLVAQRFKVYEDPRIDEVEAELPAANCGGCGLAGCRNFAETFVKATQGTVLYCPVGGHDTMARISVIMGRETPAPDPRVAVLRCNGACDYRPRTSVFDGAHTCAIASMLYSGESGCQFGCHGFADCVAVCNFDALHMDAKTGLPVVNDSKCTACGACVKACPRNLFELRKRWKGEKKIFVACMNEDKGGPARKYCSVACIGCSKCYKVCEFDAIVMNNNLAFIDSDKCKLCRKCAPECPTSSIIETGFPMRKTKVENIATGLVNP
jgi:Na+-translocating ferredoxin:NAD+ oxidoreductase RNF subunit RnfB